LTENRSLDVLETPWSRVHEKPVVIQLLEKFPAFYGSKSFIALFTTILNPEPTESSAH
jgi:hypothetical protein